jgi:hypothetical protein|tara:strand:+ start:37 stop:252 length:216 start_codon:yes stop_codon:yes gene_type:complete
MDPDMVNNPPHYNKHGIECITAIEAALTEEEFKGYVKGNVLKYTWRENYKNKLEDLKKAAWYLNRLIESIE